MTERREDSGQPPEASKTANPLLLLPAEAEQADRGLPGGGRGRVDVTGIVPEGIRVDPNITEGHPGYEESGSSGIIPPERLAGEGTGKEEQGAG